ncbi:MAG: SxtJ family membrane protein [Planctomycetota bacterium]|jgi:hypothetical protein
MSLVNINWNPDKNELKKFGIAMLVGFGIIGLCFFLFKRADTAYYCWAFGVVAGLLGLSQTKAALPVYLVWMAVAFIMGNIISRVLVVLFYYLMITPIGLIMRVIGRDKLHLKKRDTESYWSELHLSHDKDRFERQF